ncbi:MAG: helix-turn-helix transcriptional regulator [Candidatus Saccharibacteria bacterium]
MSILRLDRLLAIVVLLVNRRTVKAKDLARIFEVSERTILRDINAINQAGIPIVTYPGAGGGIGLTENYRIEQNLLALDDIIAVLRALKGVQSALNDDHLDQTIEKIEGLVPQSRASEFMDKSSQLIIDLSPWGGNEPLKEQVSLIKRAIGEKRPVSFSYANPEGSLTKRTVEPDCLLLKMHNWYLYGYCRLRGEFRLFKVSRIREIEVLDEYYTRQPSDAANLPWEQIWPNLNIIDVTLRFIPELQTIVEEYVTHSELYIEADGSVIVKSRMPDGEWLYGMILSYSDGVEVLHPPELRQKIKEKAARIQEIY